MSDQADTEGYGVSRHIGTNERHHFYGNDSYIYMVNISGKII